MGMNVIEEIKAALEEKGRTEHAYRETNDKRIADLEKGNKAAVLEADKKLEQIHADQVEAIKKLKEIESNLQLDRDRIEMIESRAHSPGRMPEELRAEEYKKTLMSWFRSKGQNPSIEMKLIDMELKMREQKDVTIGSDAGGGYAVPEQISRDIGVLEKKYSPVRDLVRVVQIGTSDYKELLTIRGATSGWVGETGSRSATGTPTIRNIVPTQGELYAYPQASEWSLDDPFFSLESWLTENVAREFALQEGSAVLTGNGTTKPTGMLNTTPVTTADYASPLRAAAAYEYVASDLTPGGSGVLADTLFDLVYKLNTSYRAAGVWIMNSTTLGAVRKLKDTTNQYLWQPGLVAGQPDRLLGYPISTWEQMSDIGANNFPVGFGDWREAYVLVDRVGLRVTRDQVTNPGYVRFYIRRRLGGIVRNNDAAKFLRTL